MAHPLRQIFAFSGVLEPGAGEKDSFALVEYALALAARAGQARVGQASGGQARNAQSRAGSGQTEPVRVCYIPTAVGDAQAAIDFHEGRFAGFPGTRLSVLRLFTQPSVPDIAAHRLFQ